MSYAEQYDRDEGIAIVGMAARLPGANDVDTLWRNVASGLESIRRVPRDGSEPAGGADAGARPAAGGILAHGVVDDVDVFDEAFFGIPAHEAARLDPALRLFLQVAWEALEHAGHDPAAFGGLIGVYAGCAAARAWPQPAASRTGQTRSGGRSPPWTGGEVQAIASRTAGELGLRGPALDIHADGSSSLVAVCTAVQALQAFQCDMALAGGVSITQPHSGGPPDAVPEGDANLSPDGHCRVFDASAAGTVPGSGLGIVVLRRLREALDAGDTVYAVIRGAAVNHDGRPAGGAAGPQVEGRAEVVATAQALAGVDPQTVGYVEADGSGIPEADAIEVAALARAFRAGGARGSGTCSLGSVTTQIGHLGAAAGVAGLLRAVLAVHHAVLPPTLHFRSPHPRLALESSPFVVHDHPRPWPAGTTLRRAGVSASGGGTNAHVVLEQCPPDPAAQPDGRVGEAVPQLLVLSAHDAPALDRASERLRRHLENQRQAGAEAQALEDIAFTLQSGRRAFALRRAWACTDLADAAAQLARPLAPAQPAHERLGVAFLFAGQGPQQPGAGHSLYDSEPLFRDEIDACAQRLREPLGGDLREWLFPSPGRVTLAQQRLAQVAFAQPALLALQLAMARLWQGLGVEPALLFGHSTGEFAAACIGGTLSRDDALLLVAQRARLIQQQPPGAMLAVRASPGQLRDAVGEGVDLAACNAPSLTVLSGSPEAIGRVQARLDRGGIAHRRVATTHALHSAMMEPVVATFESLVRRTPLRAPRLPWVSGLTGRTITAEQAQSPAYWARQLREPVQCVDALGECLSASMALLEVGPGDGLARLARQHPLHGRSPAIAASLRLSAGGAASAQLERQGLLSAVGRLWCAGARVGWPALQRGERRRVPLPTVAFARRRHGGEPLPVAACAPAEVRAEVPEEVSAAVNEPSFDGGTAGRRHEPPNPAPGERGAAAAGAVAADAGSGHDAEPRWPAAAARWIELFERQLAVLDRQLEMMRSDLSALAPEAAALARPAARPPGALVASPAAGAVSQGSRSAETVSPTGRPAVGTPAPADAGPVAQRCVAAAAEPVAQAPSAEVPGRPGEASGPVAQALTTFAARYAGYTAASRRWTQAHRAQLALVPAEGAGSDPDDPFAAPVVVVRAAGARLWDLDGHEYVDLASASGTLLFGHDPPFLRDAVRSQLDAGSAIGSPTLLAGDVSQALCAMVGAERATFWGSSDEALRAAVGIARSVTRRQTVVVFGETHRGLFDDSSARPAADILPTAGEGPPAEAADAEAAAPGTLVVLDWGDPQAMRTIGALGQALAAVLVEPVQRLHPGQPPREFLLELRRLTAASGAALVFDETTTGFRVHPGGAQAAFGVHADLAVYGRVVAAGLPVGVLAGEARFLDALDHAAARGGVDRALPLPEAFGGQPLALAASRAVLQRLQHEGPALQRELDLRTRRLVEALQRTADELGVPLRVAHFSSWFCLRLPADLPLARLLFPALRMRGVHAWEGTPCFVTTAHGDDDLQRVIDAVREALLEMQRCGCLPALPIAQEQRRRTVQPPVPGARRGRDRDGREAWFVPDPRRPGHFLALRDPPESDL